MNSSQRKMTRWAFFGMLAAAGALVCALYWTQIISGSSYAAKADKQYVKPLANSFERGSIEFSTREGTTAGAAIQAAGYTIYINPTLMSNASEAYNAIS